MNPKMMIRKKAMDMEMKAKPSIPIKKRPQPGMGQEEMNEPGEGTPGEEQDDAQEGYEAFLVSPEEKQMILSMREKMGVHGAPQESHEAPEQFG